MGAFKTLAANEAGVRHKIGSARRIGPRPGKLPVADIPPQVHSAILFGFGRHVSDTLEELAASDNWAAMLNDTGLMFRAACRYPRQQ